MAMVRFCHNPIRVVIDCSVLSVNAISCCIHYKSLLLEIQFEDHIVCFHNDWHRGKPSGCADGFFYKFRNEWTHGFRTLNDCMQDKL